MYINDISKVFKNAVLILFADETNIFIFHKTKDALLKIENEELDSLTNWLPVNKVSLSVGIDKETKFSFFTPNKNEKRENLPTLLDDCLIFKNQVAKICAKIK